MKIRGRILVILSIVGLFSCVAMPCVNAEIFDIGTKVSESDIIDFDIKLVYYDSGSRVYTYLDYINYLPLIFDGNESTGIDHDFGPGHDILWAGLNFPYPYYVSNITVKPTFGGGTSNYTLYLLIGESYTPRLIYKNSTEQTFQVNCKITGISIELFSEGTNHFFFNDVIINYTPGPSNLTDAITAIDILSNTVNSLQSQINNLTSQIDILNNFTAEMNNTFNELNQTQLQILESITDLWTTYDQLNTSIMNIFDEIENLNITTNENISLIINDMNSIETDLIDIYQSLDDLNTNVTELFEIQDIINQTTQDILSLNENITEIKSTMPSEYDDTALSTRVFQLESENVALGNQIQNLTDEIENLKSEPDDFVPLGGFILGLLGILIAITAVFLATRKQEEQEMQVEKEDIEDTSSPEDEVNEKDADS